MNISKIYIGGWFQRTTLQLSEIYDFVREGTSELALDKKKLVKLHNDLNMKEVEYLSIPQAVNSFSGPLPCWLSHVHCLFPWLAVSADIHL